MALGLSEQVNKKDERTGDYIPASLVNESVLSARIHRRGTYQQDGSDSGNRLLGL